MPFHICAVLHSSNLFGHFQRIGFCPLAIPGKLRKNSSGIKHLNFPQRSSNMRCFFWFISMIDKNSWCCKMVFNQMHLRSKIRWSWIKCWPFPFSGWQCQSWVTGLPQQGQVWVKTTFRLLPMCLIIFIIIFINNNSTVWTSQSFT